MRFLSDNTILVAVADPTNVITSDDLRIALGIEIQLVVATESDIDSALERLHPESEQDFPESDVELELESEAPEVVAAAGRRLEVVEVRDSADSAPAVRLVNEVIKRAIEQGASDVHFEPQVERLLVRHRIDGVMHPLRVVPRELQQAVTTRIKIMAELDIAERRMPQDGRVSIRFGGDPIDIRVAVLPTTHGEQVVMRILYRTARSFDFGELGLAEDTAETLTRALAQPYGCIISCGPTGSGKTTTLYAALNVLNEPGRVVMTIEDPVEYQLEGVNQIQVNPRAGLTFAQGLRTILRSDPDVLLVGEIRDDETAKIAVQAAMTGHLVLSTLHADNVASSISRLKDMGVDSSLLASTINCVFAQRLGRRLCPNCREQYKATKAILQAADFDASEVSLGSILYRAKGCGQCVDGYKGRIGMFETLARHARHAPALRDVDRRADLLDGSRVRHAHPASRTACASPLPEHTSLEEVKRVAGERRL